MNLSLITALIGLTASTVCAQLPQGETQSGEEWMPLDCKTLDHWPDYAVDPANLELSKYGGWLNAPRQTATGFFRVQKVNNRWWCVDPEGYLYIHKALNSVNLDHNTADELYTRMREYGFNGFGNWTWNGPTGGGPPDRSIITESTVKDAIPMAYTPRFGMIGSYRNERLPAGTPRIELPVFDPGFAQMAPIYAQNAITNELKNDPHLFGYFTDNELPFNTALQDHLKVTNPNDPNYQAAVNFLASRGKTPPADPEAVDEEDAKAYTALCGERYYSLVSQAIRAVDPNHMYLGSRQHSGEKGNQVFMENAGKYVDIMAVNHYHHWGDRRFSTNKMAEWLGRPLMFTEFYVKSLEDGDSAENGAGFNGRNLTSGANFYQNYITTHLESGNLVGFHWFNYRAIVGEAGALRQSGSFNNVLFDSMKKMNTQVYDFIDYLDSRPAPDVALIPEADAYFEGGTNRGTSPELAVKYASSPSISTFRQTYMRFDVSELGNQIESAKIVLRTVQAGGYGYFRVELVENDSWGETTINNGNAPAGSTVIRTYSDGRSDLEIDVSSVIRREIEGDGKFSIRIIGVLSPGGASSGAVPVYGSRRHSNPLARPVLNIEYATQPSPGQVAWDGRNGKWSDVTNWSTASGTMTPDPTAVPRLLDDVTFNVTGQQTDQIVDLDGVNRFSNSMTFRSPGSTFFRRDPVTAGTNHITLGAGGLIMQSTSGAVTFGDANQRIGLIAKTSLSLTNNSPSLLQFNSPVSSGGASDTSITLDGSGPGGVEFASTINNGSSANAVTSLNVNTTGGYTLVRNSSSNFSGGLTLTRGVLAARASNGLGTGTFTINCGTFGSVVSTRSFSNPIVINNDFKLGGANVPGLGNSTSTFSGSVDLVGGTRTITLADSASFNGSISNGGLTIIANPASRVLTLGGNSNYEGPTNLIAGTLVINGNNSAATGTISVASAATLGGKGSIGGPVVFSPGGVLSTRITDWTSAAGNDHDGLEVASLHAGGGLLNLVVTTTGLVNFTETSKSFTILNASGSITGFLPAQVNITAPGFPGDGTWALVQDGSSLVLNYTAAANAFQSWIDRFSLTDKSDHGDPDNDDINNLMEFVLNGNPGSSDTGILPVGTLNSIDFIFNYVRREDSTALPQVVQYGSDLNGWTDVAIPSSPGTINVGAITVIVAEPVSGTQTISVKIPSGDPADGKLFSRLKVIP